MTRKGDIIIDKKSNLVYEVKGVNGTFFPKALAPPNSLSILDLESSLMSESEDNFIDLIYLTGGQNEKNE